MKKYSFVIIITLFYDYLVSFEVDGQLFTVTRNEEFKSGDTMTVTKIITRESNSEKILTTEYR